MDGADLQQNVFDAMDKQSACHACACKTISKHPLRRELSWFHGARWSNVLWNVLQVGVPTTVYLQRRRPQQRRQYWRWQPHAIHRLGRVSGLGRWTEVALSGVARRMW